MVHFTRPDAGRDQTLQVSSSIDPDGYRLWIDFPDGRRVEHRYQTRPELFDGTAFVQSELLRDGWRPAETRRTPPPRQHPSRRRQFPRLARL